MNMQVETYEIEETNSESGMMAADAEAIELAESLGLKGQRQLSNPETLTRIPYPKLTAIQRLVFETLFPHKSPVEEYGEGIIPLRVLQVIAYCRQNNLYRRIEVWHPEPGKRDPVLIGTQREHSYSWSNGEDFLLARWGDALETFEALVEKAKAKWTVLRRAEIGSAVKRAQLDLAQLETVADMVFETGEPKTVRYEGF
jgi:hypothetical protein